MAISSPEQELRRKTRRGFIGLGAGALGCVGIWKWLNSGTPDNKLPPALRSVLGFNERVVRNAIYSNNHLVPTYPASAIGNIKVNGRIGIDEELDLANWSLALTPFGAASPSAKISLHDIKSLPRYEQTINFKCVEGWSTVTQFAGARFSDFTAKFAPGSEHAKCVGMKTPDEEYYVSVDTPSAMHPQTLLAYEMNGAALTVPHGAPLRLVLAVKYGIKNIKQIGSIEYTDARPDDYWAEEGYDWYAGL
ncbi:MAG: molybdopterin-dependent oxidoreductase [Terriglobia bacterium]